MRTNDGLTRTNAGEGSGVGHWLSYRFATSQPDWPKANPGQALPLKNIGRATCVWHTAPGLRFGSGGQTSLSIDLDAEAHVDEGTLVSVTFHIAANGGTPVDVVRSTQSMRIGDFTAQDSPLPGVASGLAPLPCFGYDLNLTDYPGGTLRVSATVRSNDGSQDFDTEVPSFVIYNDTDGVDRRPCTNTVYVDSATGDDGATGGSGDPLETLCGGIERLTVLAGANLRGGTIIVRAGATLTGGHFGFSSWHTGEGWLDVVFESGATMTREASDPGRLISCTGNGLDTNCNIRFIVPRFIGAAPVLYCFTGVNVTAWLDGGSSGSVYDTGSNLSARFYEDTGEIFGRDGPNIAKFRTVATCHTRGGVLNGFGTLAYGRDLLVDRWLGLAFNDSDSDGIGDPTWRTGAGHLANVLMSRQDYLKEGVDSQVLGLVDYPGGTNFVVSAQSGGAHNGKLRLTCVSAPPYDIFAHAAELVGSATLRIVLFGFDAANNGPKAVLEAGSNYMILDDAAITPQSPAGSSAQIITGNTDGSDPNGLWYGMVHPDVWRVQGNKQDCIIARLGCDTDVIGAQGLFAGGSDFLRCVWKHITIGEQCRNNWDTRSLIDCRQQHLTLAGDTGFNSSNCSGSVFTDVVFGTQGGLGSSGAALVDHCHVVSGGGVGTNSTTGTWFDDYATTKYLPDVTVRENDSGLAAYLPDEDRWSTDDEWSQGAGAFGPGLLDWGDGLPGITGTGAAFLPFNEASAATSAIAGTGSARLEDRNTATGAVAVAGTGSSLLPWTSASSAAAAIAGTGVAQLPWRGSSSAVALVSGVGASLLPFAGASSATAAIAGSGSALFEMRGVGTGALGALTTGVGVAELGLSGIATGTVLVAGFGTADLSLTGSAAAAALIAGTGAGLFTFDAVGIGVLSPLPTLAVGVATIEFSSEGFGFHERPGPPQQPPLPPHAHTRRTGREPTFSPHDRRPQFPDRKGRPPFDESRRDPPRRSLLSRLPSFWPWSQR